MESTLESRDAIISNKAAISWHLFFQPPMSHIEARNQRACRRRARPTRRAPKHTRPEGSRSDMHPGRSSSAEALSMSDAQGGEGLAFLVGFDIDKARMQGGELHLLLQLRQQRGEGCGRGARPTPAPSPGCDVPLRRAAAPPRRRR